MRKKLDLKVFATIVALAASMALFAGCNNDPAGTETPTTTTGGANAGGSGDAGLNGAPGSDAASNTGGFSTGGGNGG